MISGRLNAAYGMISTGYVSTMPILPAMSTATSISMEIA